jgi:hypothetical protein
MKGSEFLKKLNETLGVQIPEETLTQLSGIEFPDELQTKHGEIFISRERAKHDEQIVEHITKEDRKNNFKIFDEKIKQFIPLIGQEQGNVISNTFETFKKMDMLRTAVEDSIKTSKGKVSEDVRKVEEEWATKLRVKEEDYNKQLAAQEAKSKEMQLEFVIKSKLLGYNFADSFKSVKEQLTQMAIIDLKSKPYIYELENGAVAIRQEKDGVKRDVFEPNTENKLTLEKMLDTFVDPFVAKNNGASTKDDSSDDSNGKTTTTTTQANGALSHLDRMRMAAAQ